MLDQRREVKMEYQAADTSSGMIIDSFVVHLVSPTDSLDMMIEKAKALIEDQKAHLPRRPNSR